MSDIFISYASSTATQAGQVADALRSLGYGVWRDDELPAHRAYADVIEERLQAAKAVVVIWSAEAVKSEWVQSEADMARTDHKLVQVTLDGSKLPRPFDRIQCADLSGWTGDVGASGWRKVVASVAHLVGTPPQSSALAPAIATESDRRPSICVLPFANMSGDAEQEYFVDGIGEDIITDLSKISALSVISRNSAFMYKGKHVDLPRIARDLNVRYILEGSVRRAGERVRISSQLIDAADNSHVWAERYDRNISDIFALQDEISEAIVKALKLKLLPGEKAAIEQRGTSDPDAYKLYLMGRQLYLKGRMGTSPGREAIIRLCEGAIKIDADYASAWALMALAQAVQASFLGGTNDGGLAAADRALELDGALAEAHVAKARVLMNLGDNEGARDEFDVAIGLNPDSPDANFNTGLLYLLSKNHEAAIPYLEKAAILLDSSQEPVISLMGAFIATGDKAGVRRSAELLRDRSQTLLAHNPDDATTMGLLAWALAVLGEPERAHELIARGLLLNPDNDQMRANFARALGALNEMDAALDIMEPMLRHTDRFLLNAMMAGPDAKSLRGSPRFKAMLAAAEARLTAQEAAASSSTPEE
jgi:adenylate cyclase